MAASLMHGDKEWTAQEDRRLGLEHGHQWWHYYDKLKCAQDLIK